MKSASSHIFGLGSTVSPVGTPHSHRRRGLSPAAARRLGGTHHRDRAAHSSALRTTPSCTLISHLSTAFPPHPSGNFFIELANTTIPSQLLQLHHLPHPHYPTRGLRATISRMQASRHVDNAKSVYQGIRGGAGSWILETSSYNNHIGAS